MINIGMVELFANKMQSIPKEVLSKIERQLRTKLYKQMLDQQLRFKGSSLHPFRQENIFVNEANKSLAKNSQRDGSQKEKQERKLKSKYKEKRNTEHFLQWENQEQALQYLDSCQRIIDHLKKLNLERIPLTKNIRQDRKFKSIEQSTKIQRNKISVPEESPKINRIYTLENEQNNIQDDSLSARYYKNMKLFKIPITYDNQNQKQINNQYQSNNSRDTLYNKFKRQNKREQLYQNKSWKETSHQNFQRSSLPSIKKSKVSNVIKYDAQKEKIESNIIINDEGKSNQKNGNYLKKIEEDCIKLSQKKQRLILASLKKAKINGKTLFQKVQGYKKNTIESRINVEQGQK